MPNPEKGCDDLQKIFIEHIYMKNKEKKWVTKNEAWKMTAALSGAHTLGHAKLENSGYKGGWGDPKN